MALVPRLLQRVGRPLSGAVGQTRVLIASYHEKVRVYGLFSLRYSSKELEFFFFFFGWCNPLALCVCFPGDWPLWESPQRRFSGQERRQRGDGTGRGSCMRWCHEVAGTNYLCSGHNNKRSPVEENQELINCRSRMTRLSNLIKATICCMLVFYYPSTCFFGGPILLAIIMCYSISCSGCDGNTKLHVCLELLSEL